MPELASAKTRINLSARLVAGRAELEQTILTRVNAISNPREVADPHYVDGLRTAVSHALRYAIETVGGGGETGEPIPDPLLAQARLAARNGIPLDTVLRRYLAGHALFTDFLMQEASEDAELEKSDLKSLLGVETTALDRLLSAVSEEYRREWERRGQSRESRRSESVERLLAGEPLGTLDLAYDFEGWHVALIAGGLTTTEVMREVARQSNCRLLLVRRGGAILWAWLASIRPPDSQDLATLAMQLLPKHATVSIGEPGEGLAGWRLTHLQARAAFSIALSRTPGVVRYADNVLLSAALASQLTAISLRRLFTEPLSGDRDRGASARETLRVYFASDRNASSAAARLGIKRHTVTNRIRSIERALNLPLNSCAAELETALDLEDLDAARSPLASWL